MARKWRQKDKQWRFGKGKIMGRIADLKYLKFQNDSSAKDRKSIGFRGSRVLKLANGCGSALVV
jgi:hypothetical protein